MLRRSRRAGATVTLILASALLAACGKAISPAIADTAITTRVKTAILNDPSIGGLGIDVHTRNGVVTLSGGVESDVQRDRALDLARGANGAGRGAKGESLDSPPTATPLPLASSDASAIRPSPMRQSAKKCRRVKASGEPPPVGAGVR